MTTPLFYHGTSTVRLKGILAENCLRRSRSGIPKVSLTPLREVAEHWGHMSVSADRHPNNRVPDGAAAMPVVLVLDAKVLASNYTLVLYHEPGIFDWEFELYSRRNIKPLHEVLIAVEPCAQEHEAYLDSLREKPSISSI